MITGLLGRSWKLPPPAFAIERVRDQSVPMRDGVNLLADVFRPVGARQPATVLMRSPYGRGGLFIPMARIFAGQGYTTVLQSVRGTFGSGGQFDPFFQERDDGIDTVAWIERQPWYHGKLGLYGASYLGFVGWAIAAELGDRIAAISAAMTTSDFHASIYEGGGFRLEDYVKWISGVAMQERTSVLVRSLKERLFGDPIKGVYAGLPLATLDEKATGREMAFWRTWIEHDDPADPFWRPIQNGYDMARITAPVSLVGGWSDIFIPCQARDFKAMRTQGKATRLTLGPWTHSNFRGVGEGIRDALEWFDIHLRGHPHPAEALDRIRVWVNGADEWREFREWPTGTTRLSLAPNGTLTPQPHERGQLRFTYDPNDPTPSLEGAKLGSRSGRGDMSELAARSDVLIFDGPRLEAPLELLGDISVTLTTASGSPYHDLFICLCDLGPGGKAINITDGYKRLTPASGDPDGRTTTVEALPVAWRLDVGHRLRLLVAGGAFPRFARNLGRGEPLATATEGHKVDITVYCDAGTSYLSI
jgi:putative CocE/NonD family hydrolase